MQLLHRVDNTIGGGFLKVFFRQLVFHWVSHGFLMCFSWTQVTRSRCHCVILCSLELHSKRGIWLIFWETNNLGKQESHDPWGRVRIFAVGKCSISGGDQINVHFLWKPIRSCAFHARDRSNLVRGQVHTEPPLTTNCLFETHKVLWNPRGNWGLLFVKVL